MKVLRTVGAALIAAALLASCNDGNDDNFGATPTM